MSLWTFFVSFTHRKKKPTLILILKFPLYLSLLNLDDANF